MAKSSAPCAMTSVKASPRTPSPAAHSSHSYNSGGSATNKSFICKILLLDDIIQTFQIPLKANGQVLWEAICKKLHLLEADYFDLEFMNANGITYWLDRNKMVFKQVAPNSSEARFSFVVKFFPPDPHLLDDEFTRYLFALQIKRDLQAGQLACSETTAALLSAYIVQAEIGDYLEDVYQNNVAYLQHLRLIPDQSVRFLNRVLQLHKALVGMAPAEADYHLLDTVRKCEFYGLRLYPAKDHEGIPMTVSVAHNGIIVLQNMIKINLFSWAKIRKISFKRKKFIIKLHADTCNFYNDIVEFYYSSRDESKNFWKSCIEYHTFFRCHSANDRNSKASLVSTGSTYRYIGRTQKELIEYVRENYVKRPPFVRISSANYVKMHAMAPAAARYNNNGSSNNNNNNTAATGPGTGTVSGTGSGTGTGGTQSTPGVSFRVGTASGTTVSARSHTSTATSGSHTFDEDEDEEDAAALDDEDAQHQKQQKRRTLELINARAGRNSLTSSITSPRKSEANIINNNRESLVGSSVTPSITSLHRAATTNRHDRDKPKAPQHAPAQPTLSQPLKSNLKRTSEPAETNQIDYGGVFVGEVQTDNLPEWLRTRSIKKRSGESGPKKLLRKEETEAQQNVTLEKTDESNEKNEKNGVTSPPSDRPRCINSPEQECTFGPLLGSPLERPLSPPANFAEALPNDSNRNSLFSPPLRSPLATPAGEPESLSKDILFVANNIQQLLELELELERNIHIDQSAKLQQSASASASSPRVQRAADVMRKLNDEIQLRASPPIVKPPKVLSPTSPHDRSIAIVNEFSEDEETPVDGEPMLAIATAHLLPLKPPELIELQTVVHLPDLEETVETASCQTVKNGIHLAQPLAEHEQEHIHENGTSTCTGTGDAVTYVLNKRVVRQSSDRCELSPATSTDRDRDRDKDRDKDKDRDRQRQVSSPDERDSFSDSESMNESMRSSRRGGQNVPPMDDRHTLPRRKHSSGKQRRRRRDRREKSPCVHVHEDGHAPGTMIKSPKVWRAEYMNQQRQLAMQRLGRSRTTTPQPNKDGRRTTAEFCPPFEYVNVYRLPPLDSYSCVDDTVAVDNFQAEIQEHMRNAKLRKQKEQQSACEEAKPEAEAEAEAVITDGVHAVVMATTIGSSDTARIVLLPEPEAFIDDDSDANSVETRKNSVTKDGLTLPSIEIRQSTPLPSPECKQVDVDADADGDMQVPVISIKMATPLPSPSPTIDNFNTKPEESEQSQSVQSADDASPEPSAQEETNDVDEDSDQNEAHYSEPFGKHSLGIIRLPEIEPDDEAQYEEEEDDEMLEDSARANRRSIPHTRYFVGRFENATREDANDEYDEDDSGSPSNAIVTANSRELYALDEESSDDLRQYDDGSSDSEPATVDEVCTNHSSPLAGVRGARDVTDCGSMLTAGEAASVGASEPNGSVCSARSETRSNVTTETSISVNSSAPLASSDTDCGGLVNGSSSSLASVANTEHTVLVAGEEREREDCGGAHSQSTMTASFRYESDAEIDENAFPPPPPEFLLETHDENLIDDEDEHELDFVALPSDSLNA